MGTQNFAVLLCFQPVTVAIYYFWTYGLSTFGDYIFVERLSKLSYLFLSQCTFSKFGGAHSLFIIFIILIYNGVMHEPLL